MISNSGDPPTPILQTENLTEGRAQGVDCVNDENSYETARCSRVLAIVDNKILSTLSIVKLVKDEFDEFDVSGYKDKYNPER